MSRTKIIGILVIVASVVNVAVDALNGGEFNLQSHYDTIMAALAGAGLITLRAAINK